MRRTVPALLLLALAAPSCRPGDAGDAAYRAQVEKAREARLAELTAEDGWLSLVARHLLAPAQAGTGLGFRARARGRL